MAKEYKVINKDCPYTPDRCKIVVISESTTTVSEHTLTIDQLKSRISGRDYQISVLQKANEDDQALISDVLSATGLDLDRVPEVKPEEPAVEEVQ